MGRGARWSVVGTVLLTLGTLTACGLAQSPADEDAGAGGSLDALRDRVEAQRTAHLELDPAMLAAGVADTFLSVDEGRLTRRTRDDVLARFETYFDGVRYDEWTDLVEPVILELASTLLGDRYVRHGSKGTAVSTREEYVETIADLRSRHDDLVFRIHDIGAERDRVWSRWSATGVERASGRAIAWSGIQQYRLADGRIVETWLGTRPEGADWDDAFFRD